MNSLGIVTKCKNEFAFVKIIRNSMCGDDCGNCNLCAKKEIEIKALNTIGAKEGDKVELKMPEESGFLASLFTYGIPMLLLIAGIIGGAFVDKAELFSIVALIVIAIWYLVLFFLEKNKKYSKILTPEIEKILKE
jgi:positive regulator of sigma E activity